MTTTEELRGLMADAYLKTLDELDMVEAENDRLRALVRDVWDAALHPETFGDGGHLLRRMRELGIEV